MAVLKHTSPTAKPVAPRPWPAITVPSASTSRPVNGASSQGLGACVVMAIQPGGTCREFALLDGATGPVRLGPVLGPVVGPCGRPPCDQPATGTCHWDLRLA